MSFPGSLHVSRFVAMGIERGCGLYSCGGGELSINCAEQVTVVQSKSRAHTPSIQYTHLEILFYYNCK
jgi:hypothetical protein